MRFERGLLAAWVVMCACGPVVGHDDQRDCAQDGPVRLLALHGDEVVGGLGPSRIDDRLFVAVGRAAPVESDDGFPMLAIDDARVVSLGTCGESPKVIAEDVTSVYQDQERFPGELLGRNANDDDLVLDPSGAAPAKVFAPALPSYSLHSDVGRVGVAEGVLTLQPYPAQLGDPPPPTVSLLEAVADPFSFAVRDSEAIALTVDGELYAIDLETLGSNVIAHDVDGFAAVGKDETIVFVQAADTGFGPATLLDRATGMQMLLADDASPSLIGSFGDEIVLDRDPVSGVSQRVITLPDLTSWDLPLDLTFVHRTDGGTVLARRGQNELVRYDVDSGEDTVLFDGFVMSAIFDEDAAELFLPDGAGNLFQLSGELWRVPYSGDPPVRLADRVGEARRRLADGRIVSVVDVDADYLGTLTVVDPATRAAQVIDHDVYVMGLVAGPVLFQPDVVDDGLVLYDVRDGDRSGLWLAQP